MYSAVTGHRPRYNDSDIQQPNKSLEPTAENVAKIIASMLFRQRISLVLWSLAAAHLTRWAASKNLYAHSPVRFTFDMYTYTCYVHRVSECHEQECYPCLIHLSSNYASHAASLLVG